MEITKTIEHWAKIKYKFSSGTSEIFWVLFKACEMTGELEDIKDIRLLATVRLDMLNNEVLDKQHYDSRRKKLLNVFIKNYEKATIIEQLTVTKYSEV